MFTFHRREIEELVAKKELSERQAEGLAALINVEPAKQVVDTDCQTSIVLTQLVPAAEVIF